MLNLCAHVCYIIFLCDYAAKEYCANGASSTDSRLIEEVQCSQEAQGLSAVIHLYQCSSVNEFAKWCHSINS